MLVIFGFGEGMFWTLKSDIIPKDRFCLGYRQWRKGLNSLFPSLLNHPKMLPMVMWLALLTFNSTLSLSAKATTKAKSIHFTVRSYGTCKSGFIEMSWTGRRATSYFKEQPQSHRAQFIRKVNITTFNYVGNHQRNSIAQWVTQNMGFVPYFADFVHLHKPHPIESRLDTFLDLLFWPLHLQFEAWKLTLVLQSTPLL